MNEQRHEQLSRIVIKGFKSIKECEIDLKSINVLIGANGAGKSNFISIFEMLQNILAGALTVYALKKGISPLLYNGKEATDSILAEFYFGSNLYSFDLEWTDYDSLFFSEERIETENTSWVDGGYKETKVRDALRTAKIGKEVLRTLLNPVWRVYQFSNTSPTSKMKAENGVCDYDTLMWDASNLAVYLYHLREYYPASYQKILKAIQRVTPFFQDFECKRQNKCTLRSARLSRDN